MLAVVFSRRPFELAAGWLEVALRLVYPEVCQLCESERATPSEGYVCHRCRSRVHRIEPPFCECCGIPFDGQVSHRATCSNCRNTHFYFSRSRSAAITRDPLLEVIHHFKYHRALWFEPFLAALLIDVAVPDLAGGSWDWLVPVPLHSTRLREREFNQAERLALRLSRATGIPVNTSLIRRHRPTRSQTTLTREARAENMRNAIGLRRAVDLEGRRLVVIDDVFTTGATTNACAAALVKAGAAEVCVWTVARGI